MLIKSTLFLQWRCLSVDVPDEVHQCHQARVNGPTPKAQKQLSFQEAGAEGCCDLPDSTTSATVPIAASFSNECREKLPFNEGKNVL